VSYIDQVVLAPIRARLLQNKVMRQKYGALLQDLECKEGEVFYGNLKPHEFDALPLSSKRKGAQAYVVRLFLEKVPDANSTKVIRRTFEELYGDKESVGVFLRVFELDGLGLMY
jgi:hypothetical protein